MPHQTISLPDITIIGLIGQDAWDKAHQAANEYAPDDARAYENFLQGWLGSAVETALRNPR